MPEVVLSKQANLRIYDEKNTVNKPLKRVLEDTADAATIEQIRDLPFESFDSLLENSSAEIVGRHIKVNSNGNEFLRRAIKHEKMNSGKIHQGTAASSR